MPTSDDGSAAPGRTRHPRCRRRLAVDRRRRGDARHHRRVRGHGHLRLAAPGRAGRGPPCPGPWGPASLGGGARGGAAGAALALVLVALLLWAGAYAAELGATDFLAQRRWGDLKYVGIVLLPPAWFAFAALFAGRQSWVNGRNLALLSIHPVVVLL